MGNKKWENGIDILKIICMCFIIITHCNWSDDQRKLLLFPFWIDMAVPMLMIITGYNYYNSFDSYDNHCKKTIKNLQRILIPFFITISLQYLVLSIYKKKLISPLYIIKGGYGPGGYYTIVMIQIIMLFPVIYKIVKKFRYGFCYIILVNIILEFIWSNFTFLTGSILILSKDIYRLLAFRYFGFIAVGSWYAKTADNKHIVYKLRYVWGTVGAVLIYLWQYKGINLYIFDNEWAPSNLPGIFIAFAYFLLIKEIDVKVCKFVTELAKSTFHIFLFQMCYFEFIFNDLSKIINKKLLMFNVALSIMICFSGGYLFYKCEYILRRKLQKVLKN